MKFSFNRFPVFLMMWAVGGACMLDACTSEPAKSDQVSETDVRSLQSNIFMLSDRPPFEHSSSDGFIKTVNAGLSAVARAQKSDSVNLLIAEDSLKIGSKPLTYDDIRFFPVTGTVQLKKMLTGDYNRIAHLDSLRKFDSTKQFAFVVTHPPAFENILYANFLDQKLPIEKRAKKEPVTWLDLTTEHMEPQEGVIGTQWQTDIFFVDRLQADSLMVLFRGDTIYFPLSK